MKKLLARLRSPAPDSIAGMALQTVRELFDDGALKMSASLAYCAALSLAPLVVLTLGIAGLVTDRQRTQEYVVAEVEKLLGEGSAALVATVAEEQRQKGTGAIAALVGLIALLFGATAVFAQLQDGLNVIWDVEPRPGQGLRRFLRKRLISLAMVASLGFLLLVSLMINALIAALTARLSTVSGEEGLAGTLLNLLVSMVVSTLLFGLIFRVLPDARISWHDAWRGAAVTAALFLLGEWGIGEYLGRAGVGSAYGAAGALVVMLVWVFYSSLIVFAGAEFTQVYAMQRGRGIIQPEPGAKRGNSHAPAGRDAAPAAAKAG